MSAFDPKRTFLLSAIRKRNLPVIGSRGYLLPALRTATPPCCAVGGPAPQRHRHVRGRTRTKSGSRMALQVLGCDADVSLRPAGIPYQFQCAEIAPRRWLGVHLALSPTKLLSSGRTLLESFGRRRTRTAVLSSPGRGCRIISDKASFPQHGDGGSGSPAERFSPECSSGQSASRVR